LFKRKLKNSRTFIDLCHWHYLADNRCKISGEKIVIFNVAIAIYEQNPAFYMSIIARMFCWGDGEVAKGNMYRPS